MLPGNIDWPQANGTHGTVDDNCDGDESVDLSAVFIRESSTSSPNTCKWHVWTYDINCPNCKIRGSEDISRPTSDMGHNLRVALLKSQARVRAASGSTSKAFLAWSPRQLQKSSKGKGSSMTQRQPSTSDGADDNEYQEASSSSVTRQTSKQKRDASVTFSFTDRIGDSEDEEVHPPTDKKRKSSLTSKKGGGTDKALYCPDHGLMYEEACADCEFRQKVVAVMFARRAKKMKRPKPEYPDFGTSQRSLGNWQNEDSETATGTGESRMEGIVATAVNKGKGRADGYGPLRGKENVPARSFRSR